MGFTVPKVQISTTPARIQVQTGPAQVRTTNRPAQVSISSSDPQVEVQGGKVNLEINWKATHAEIGMKDWMAVQRTYRDQSLQAGLQGISRICNEGDSLMQIENGGKVISSIAMAVTDHEVSFGMGFMPMTPPDVTVTVTQPRVSGEGPNVNIRPQIYPALTRVTPNQVNVDVVQTPKVNIDFLGQFVDLLAK